jgi:hypothetical protein
MPYASDGKVRGVFSYARKIPKLAALKKPNIQINGPRRIGYLSFDIDRDIGALAWEDANLPPPNLVVVNPRNGHAHLIYELREPVWLPRRDDMRPEPKVVGYLKAVQKAMGRALRADPHYNGLLVKNPLHASWRVSCLCREPYDLADLSRHLELTDTPEAKLLDSPDGRNCTLFESLRLWSYRAKRDFADQLSFHAAITAELDRLNELLTKPLGLPELKGIAKSVSNWTWNRYTGNGKRRGIMCLNPADPLDQRQREGQDFTSRTRCSRTLSRIKQAYESIMRDGLRVTKTLVANRCNIHRNTVSKYWSRVLGMIGIVTGDLPAMTVAVEGSVLESIPSVGSFTDSLTRSFKDETVSLRDESMCSLRSRGASPGEGDTLIPTQQCTPDTPECPESFDQVKSRYRPGEGFVRAFAYSMQWARKGIVIAGVPEKFKSLFQREVDMFYERKPTTQ